MVGPQTEPTIRLAAKALRRPWSRGRAKPRHPSSSPTALPGKIENRSIDSVPATVATTTGAGTPNGVLTQVELATLEWVEWWNHRRVHTALGGRSPAEYEALYHQDQQQPVLAGATQTGLH